MLTNRYHPRTVSGRTPAIYYITNTRVNEISARGQAKSGLFRAKLSESRRRDYRCRSVLIKSFDRGRLIQISASLHAQVYELDFSRTTIGSFLSRRISRVVVAQLERKERALGFSIFLDEYAKPSPSLGGCCCLVFSRSPGGVDYFVKLVQCSQRRSVQRIHQDIDAPVLLFS